MNQPLGDPPGPQLTSARFLRRLLAEHDIRLSQALGQHFLADANILSKMVQACTLEGHEPVVEVGAGVGTLTLALAPHAGRLWAVEKDQQLIPILREHVRSCETVEVVRADFRHVELAVLGQELVIAGNLPYGITSEVLLKLIRERTAVCRAVLMVQQEVGQRLVQDPGPHASRLGVHLSAYYDLQVLRRVPRTAFYPPPEVNSVLLSLRRLSSSRIQSSPEAFEQVLKALFGARRKTACNALSKLASRQLVTQALTVLGRHPSVRGEALSVEEVDALAQRLLHSD
ncbi:MAG: 16S rRNA (adenine(1518)-N(6)/adenine(1519)-N(6))-dimethyltransferase RsmA [Candidatus Bipolaricaulota bacterium]